MSALNKKIKSIVPDICTDNVNNFVSEVRTIILCIGNNSTIFISPTPSLDILAQSLADLEIAEFFVNDNVPGSIPARNKQRDKVLKAVHDLYNYVIRIAEEAEDKSTVESIVNASGFGLTYTRVNIEKSIVY